MAENATYNGGTMRDKSKEIDKAIMYMRRGEEIVIKAIKIIAKEMEKKK